jgi:hypothetical protein
MFKLSTSHVGVQAGGTHEQAGGPRNQAANDSISLADEKNRL